MRSLVRRTPLAVMLGLFLAIWLVPQARAAPRYMFSADIYGSYAYVGKTVLSGKSAYVGIGCSARPGTHAESSMQSNEEENENTGRMSVRSIKTTADAIQNSDVTKSLSTSTSNGVSLFKGRITASRVRAISATLRDGDGLRTSAAGSALTDLVVDGRQFEVTPKPNTRVPLDGLGYVILNEQASRNNGRSAVLAVKGIRVVVTERNPMGIPIGSQYIVSHAQSALMPPPTTVLGGHAFGHKLFEGQRAQSGPSAKAYVPCVGTNGKPRINTIAGVGHPGAFQTGTVWNTAMGRVAGRSATAKTTSSVESLNLLNGLVTADAVRAVALASKQGNSRALSNAGSKFVNLVVAGRPMGSETGPNREIQLPGIGTLWLQRVFRTSNGIEVRMIELVVSEENPFGLKPGSKLMLAVARASVR